MTDNQIEIAARKLCELRGTDPELKVHHGADPSPGGFMVDICLISPAWVIAAREIKSIYQVMEAIDYSLRGE